MTNRLRVLLLALLTLIAAFAAAEGEATFSAKLERADVRAGEVGRIVVSVALKEGWHTYSIVPTAKQPGPFPTTLISVSGDGIEPGGPLAEQKPIRMNDENFGQEVGLFEKSAEFYVPFKVKEGAQGSRKVTATLKYMVCNAVNCLRPTEVKVSVDLAVAPGEARAEFAKVGGSPSPSIQTTSAANGAAVDQVSADIQKAKDSGLLPFMLFAFVAGLFSLLTPCVFPMIPITVSYFTKQKGENEKIKFAGPTAYCLGIIATFTGLGVLISASGVRFIATNVWVNLGLALLFIVLAASLFGVFEIRLPSALINKANSKSRSGGLIGPLLMGFTFTLTSFTCTVPFVGSLLASSTQGGKLYPFLGMLSFSTAFALPFFALALFPSWLGKLPRSGSWLVTVKAFMGFLELMAALKFLSNVDLAFGWAIITRPVFLAVWAATAGVGALYLLGWLRLPHDGDVKIGWMRRVFGVATVALAIFCLGGLRGNRLGSLAAFLPPTPYPGQEGGELGALTWEKTYDGALAKAKATGKNVFIDFTGIYCTNCRAIEENVFTRPEVEDQLGKFVLAKLFTDHGTPEDDANLKLQIEFSKVETLPVYVIVSPEGKVLKVHQQEPPIEDAQQMLKAITPFAGTAVAMK